MQILRQLFMEPPQYFYKMYCLETLGKNKRLLNVMDQPPECWIRTRLNWTGDADRGSTELVEQRAR